MMQKSTRFISLSGFSGIFAGLYALIGAWIAYEYLDFYMDVRTFFAQIGLNAINKEMIIFLIIDATIVLVLALATSLLLTYRNSRKRGEKLDSPAAKRLALSMLVPLSVGGLFSLILLIQGHIGLVAPSLLLFYGLTLIQASDYTLHDIKFLGYVEIAIGFLALLDARRGLLYWTMGFGVLHIIYGVYMYVKHERKGHA